jgi:hypothetical protein
VSNYRSGSYHSAVADCNTGQNYGACSNPYIVADMYWFGNVGLFANKLAWGNPVIQVGDVTAWRNQTIITYDDRLVSKYDCSSTNICIVTNNQFTFRPHTEANIFAQLDVTAQVYTLGRTYFNAAAFHTQTRSKVKSLPAK